MRRVLSLFTAMTVTLLAGLSAAQIPDKFTNLTVLPKDIAKPDLVQIMRGFSQSLGTRCDHCHVESEVAGQRKMDFAADDKDAKKIARKMIGLVGTVNTELTNQIGAMRPDRLKVGCFTCHHGNVRPETLEQALVAVLERDGVDSTLVKYRALRDEFYGQAAYDFSEWSLIQVAENVAKNPDRKDAALALLNLNLQYYPESAGTYARMAETYLAAGDRDTAMKNFDKAISLAPNDPWLKRRVEQVKAKP